MAKIKSMMDAPTKVKKAKAESRRYSTGGAAIILSEPIPIPNYMRMRASIGSCHDLCKYGARRHSDDPKPNAYRGRNNNAAASSSTTKLPRKQQHNETLKSTCKRRSSQPLESSIPRTKPRSKSLPKKVPNAQSQKLVETSESCHEISYQTAQEKIIHAVETIDLTQDEDNHVEDQSQKMDSISNDPCSIKSELNRGEVEVGEAENRDISWKEIRLRRVVSEGDSELKKEECMRIIEIGKNKVKALVNTFETLMTTRDSEGSTPCSSLA